MDKRDLALDLFRSYKTGIIKKSKPIQERTNTPGDPTLISEVISDLINQRDWHLGIAEGTLFTTWSEIVGKEIAAHATPISILDGVLTVQTSSTAWSTQLSLVANDLLATIQKSPSGALVDSLVFFGPQAPNWKKGIRTIRGARGARDTYGYA